MIEIIARPAPIRTDSSNTFAHYSMHTRVPRILREVQELNPDYDPLILSALDALHDAIQGDAPIPMLDLPAPDYDDWAAEYQAVPSATWLNAPWFFAEVYFYRQMMQAVRWWETNRDPFTPKKDEELLSATLWERLDLALESHAVPLEERLASAFKHALWGNRVDLSYAVAAAHGNTWTLDDLLVDDSLRVSQVLMQSGGMLPGGVHLVTDNAGTELAADLALVDTLLDGVTERVTLHLKLHPTFVSDATLPDVLGFLKLIGDGEHGKPARLLASRLRKALRLGRLRLAPDGYWNSSRFAWDMPPRLVKLFGSAALVIFKGDANYRRLVGDAIWPTDTPFDQVMAYFPAPVMALRTLKSDPVVGLPSGMAARLDPLDTDWRINGKRGVIQFRAKP